MYRPPPVATNRPRTPRPGRTVDHVCTIARSRAGVARLLDTLHAHEPTCTATVLVPRRAGGQLPTWGDAEVITIDDLGLDEESRADLPLIYDADELHGALVPHLLDHVAQQGDGWTWFVSDDTEVHGPLEALIPDDDGAVAALCPSVTSPEPDDGLAPSAEQALLHGRFALGAVGVRSGAAPLLRWWAARCRWDALHDATRGLMGAARWLDLAPTLFRVSEVRHPGVVMGPLGLHDQTLEASSLVLLRLPGLDRTHPALLDPGLRNPRHLLSEQPRLAELVQGRLEALDGQPDELLALPLVGDLLARRMVHGALRDAREADRPPPFAVEGDVAAGLGTWLGEAVARPGVEVSRWLHAVWASRPDLRVAFPAPLGESAEALTAWARTDPDHQARCAALGVVDAPPSPLGAAAVRPGFDLVGYLDAELGLGEAARLMTRALGAAGVPHSTLTFRETRSRQVASTASTSARPQHSTTLLCVNADQTPLASACMPDALDAGRHRIGYWFWEVDEFPHDQRQALWYVDELWVASEHVASALHKITDKPVTVVPQPVAPALPTSLRRADLGLDDRFTFAYWFDAFSSVERKNPIGAVRAFIRAFRPDEGPVLLVKALNGRADRRAMEELRASTHGRPDIRVIDEHWSGLEMRSLVQLIDCYVSPHRAEGFGQTMAEAMMAARPVIATGYSGNLQFMNDTNSLLVPYELVPVGPGHEPYPPHAQWAEPDVSETARLMRAVVEDEALRRSIGERAALDIEASHGMAATSRWLRQQFQQSAGAADLPAWPTLVVG